MRILFNNVDFNSRSGPNGFGLKLANCLSKVGHQIVDKDPDAVLNFIQGNLSGFRNVLRLDGIYFNTDQDWEKQNSPIKLSYDLADSVIVQSEFNRKLVQEYFGNKREINVINNGTSLDVIELIPSAKLQLPKEKNWLCASSWRPHKRLLDNVRYFQQYADSSSNMYVAGNGDVSVLRDLKDDRIKYVGDLSWYQLISLMKSCSNFVHLAYLDHCPNVVVDARASGCRIHCSSSGGTKEVAGKNSIMVLEDDWDFKPTKLYSPPSLDFNSTKIVEFETDINMISVSKKYIQVLEGYNES